MFNNNILNRLNTLTLGLATLFLMNFGLVEEVNANELRDTNIVQDEFNSIQLTNLDGLTLSNNDFKQDETIILKFIANPTLFNEYSRLNIFVEGTRDYLDILTISEIGEYELTIPVEVVQNNTQLNVIANVISKNNENSLKNLVTIDFNSDKILNLDNVLSENQLNELQKDLDYMLISELEREQEFEQHGGDILVQNKIDSDEFKDNIKIENKSDLNKIEYKPKNRKVSTQTHEIFYATNNIVEDNSEMRVIKGRYDGEKQKLKEVIQDLKDGKNVQIQSKLAKEIYLKFPELIYDEEGKIKRNLLIISDNEHKISTKCSELGREVPFGDSEYSTINDRNLNGISCEEGIDFKLNNAKLSNVIEEDGKPNDLLSILNILNYFMLFLSIGSLLTLITVKLRQIIK